jgi:alpha-beta hydrolase superfamily lysophospholipase
MPSYDLSRQFITDIALPRTAQAYPRISYADEANAGRGLFSRTGWYPTDTGGAPKAIYVLIVGTAEAIEKHAPAIADVRARGNDVLVFEFAGQGGSGRFLADGRKVHTPRDGFDMWTDSLKELLRCELFRAVRRRGYDHGIPVVALPYSLGGHMFARMIQEAPAFARRFTHIVYVNPVVAMNTAGSMAMRIVQQIYARCIVMRPGRADDYVPGHGRFHPGDRPLEKSSIGSDRARHQWLCDFYHANPHLAMWGMTNGWFVEANRSLTQLWDGIIDNAAKSPFVRIRGEFKSQPVLSGNLTRVPTLVVSSQLDTIVIAHYVRRFARHIRADVLELPYAKHEPSQEPPPIRESTFDAVGAWVQDPVCPEIPRTAEIRFVAAKTAGRRVCIQRG